MSQQSVSTLKTYFQTGDIPTQAQFEALLDSFLNFVDGKLNDPAGTLVAEISTTNEVIQLFREGMSCYYRAATYNNVGTGESVGFSAFKARGTKDAPSAVLINDIIARFIGTGYGASTFGSSTGALNYVASENFTDTAKGTIFKLLTTPNGSVTKRVVLQSDDAGSMIIPVLGAGINLKFGANARQGQATLDTGEVDILTDKITASSIVIVTVQECTDPSSAGNVFVKPSSVTPGVGFTISSSNGADSSTVNWIIIEPA